MGRPATICILTDECIHARACDSLRSRTQIISTAKETHSVPNSLLVEHSPTELADAVARAAENAGAKRRSITLVIPAQWCFTHVIESTRKTITTEALGYEFEQYIPVPLEEVTCAFLPLGGGRVLTVAVPTDPMGEVVSALSERGIEVEHITVDVIALADAREEGTAPACVAIIDARWVRIMTGAADGDGCIITAFSASATESPFEAINNQLRHRSHQLTDAPNGSWLLAVIHTGLAHKPLGPPSDGDSSSACLSPDETVEAIAGAVAFAPPRLDLRTGPLGSRSRWETVARLAGQCLMCLLALVLVAASGIYLQKRPLQEQIRAIDYARRDIYREVFDTDSLPPGAAMRLASERIRLEGLTRARHLSPTASIEPSSPPLDTLRNIVDSLPADVRVMLTDVRLDERQLTLHGQTSEHRDAERIVEAINHIPRVTARPPRTTRLPGGGVEFSIIASRVDDNGVGRQSRP